MRHFLSLLLIQLIVIFTLVGCKGISGDKDSRKQGDQLTDRTAQLKPGPEGEEALRELAFEGDLEGVKSFLKQGVNCNAMDQDGHTALMLAAFNGHSEVVLSLLEAGGAIDQRDNSDRTALLYGATGPFPETVEILLVRGADPNKVDSEEHFSPLMHAAAEGNLEVVKVLIKYGADRSLKDVDGDDAATFATQAGHMQVVEYLNMAEH
jgi:ankyrin repeat protein